MKELTIQYGGGSGGFLLLHMILLAGTYKCKFRNDRDFDQFLQEHWDIKDHSRWKVTEVWPDNQATINSDYSNKVYFSCNPGINTQFPFDARGRRIVLFTDLRSQIRLSRYKNACFYVAHSGWKMDLMLQRQWRAHYANIRDPAWPACVSTRKFWHLPWQIRIELLQHPETENMVCCRNYDDWIFRKNVAWYKDIAVDCTLLPYLQQADDTLTLQELVNDPHKTFQRLGFGELNQSQLNLMQHWRSLHDPSLLDRVGIHTQ